MSSDLFCAFQPNRVTDPSLPDVCKKPVIPSDALDGAPAGAESRFAISSLSGTFSTSPRPKVGVGIRKLMVLPAKFGCDWTLREQPGASVRPAIVKIS